jgi:hypothetical protein
MCVVSPLRYNRVPESYWVLSRDWNERLRNLGLYVQTCRHRTGEGLYYLPLAYAADDLNWSLTVTQKHMKELVDREFIGWDSRAQVVLLVNALEVQAPTTEKQIKGAIERLKHLPPTDLLSELHFLAQVHSNGFADSIRMAFPNACEWVSNPHSNGGSATHSNSHALAHAHSPKA